MSKRIKVECTWGWAEDVYIEFNFKHLKGDIGITAEEARQLADELIIAAARCDELEDGIPVVEEQ